MGLGHLIFGTKQVSHCLEELFCVIKFSPEQYFPLIYRQVTIIDIYKLDGLNSDVAAHRN